jgi:hypothetical protein
MNSHKRANPHRYRWQIMSLNQIGNATAVGRELEHVDGLMEHHRCHQLL